jgi:hypothetical protein
MNNPTPFISLTVKNSIRFYCGIVSLFLLTTYFYLVMTDTILKFTGMAFKISVLQESPQVSPDATYSVPYTSLQKFTSFM